MLTFFRKWIVGQPAPRILDLPEAVPGERGRHQARRGGERTDPRPSAARRQQQAADDLHGGVDLDQLLGVVGQVDRHLSATPRATVGGLLDAGPGFRRVSIPPDTNMEASSSDARTRRRNPVGTCPVRVCYPPLGARFRTGCPPQVDGQQCRPPSGGWSARRGRTNRNR